MISNITFYKIHFEDAVPMASLNACHNYEVISVVDQSFHSHVIETSLLYYSIGQIGVVLVYV